MKSIKREKQRRKDRYKDIKHGIGNRKPIEGISKTMKKILKGKITITKL